MRFLINGISNIPLFSKMVLSQWGQFYCQGNENWFLGGGLPKTLYTTVVSGLPEGRNIHAMCLCGVKMECGSIKKCLYGSLWVNDEPKA